MSIAAVKPAPVLALVQALLLQTTFTSDDHSGPGNGGYAAETALRPESEPEGLYTVLPRRRIRGPRRRLTSPMIQTV
jgi:hypothetical protein